MATKKTIKLQEETYDKLTACGTKSETYDDVVDKLIVLWNKTKKRL